MPGDPAGLLARSQRLTETEIAEQRSLFGLDQPLIVAVLDVPEGDGAGQSGDLVPHRSAGASRPSATGCGRPSFSLASAPPWPSCWACDGHQRGVAARVTVRPDEPLRIAHAVLHPRGLARHAAAHRLRRLARLVSRTGQYDSGDGSTGLAHVADVLNHLFLPAATLALGYGASYLIVMRSSLLEVKDEDFVAAARAKGLTETMVRRRHAVPNAFLPSFTLIVLSFGFVLGGAIVIETIFSYPGIGQLTYQAIDAYDYPVLQGVFLISSIAVVIANLVADITYGFLDPRIEEV